MKICPNCKFANDDFEVCHQCGITFEKWKDSKLEAKSFSFLAKGCCWLAAWILVILAVLKIDPNYLRTALFFPIGFFALLPNSDNAVAIAFTTLGWSIGWVLYFALSVAMFLTKKKSVFIIIFTIFCVLLAINVVGCQHVLKNDAPIQ